MNNSINLNINIDKDIKNQSEKILNDLGIDISKAINIFLKQVIKHNGIPFTSIDSIPNTDAIDAIEESILLANDNVKGYSNIADLKIALENDE